MFRRILVPVDGSSPSDQALVMARRMAQETGGELRIVHVLDHTAYLTGYDPVGIASGALYEAVRRSGTEILEQAEAAARQHGAAVDAVLVDRPGTRLGEAVAEAALQWAADLVVVGTHGRGGPSRLLLGSGAEQIIRLSPVPVLVTRAGSAKS
jgi:nucleotide-binding universal stress UspA family protein